MNRIQQVLVSEGLVRPAAEIGLAGVRGIELELRQLQFQRTEMPALSAVCSRPSLSVRSSRMARV
jgi:hypothetical protein